MLRGRATFAVFTENPVPHETCILAAVRIVKLDARLRERQGGVGVGV